MQRIELTYLNGLDIARLALSDEAILAAVEDGLRAQGRGDAVIEPRVHLRGDPSVEGHFNVLRGSIPAIGLAGVKVVGDFVENYRRGLPSEMAVLNLFDPATGMPKAVLDATAITEMRTGAVTAIGARYLARADARVPRSRRGARHRLLERATSGPIVRLRRDPCPFSSAGEQAGIRQAAVGRSWQAGLGDRRLEKLR